jgi:hypothetical protein
MHVIASTSDRTSISAPGVDLAEGLAAAPPKSVWLQAAGRLEELARKVEQTLAEQFRILDELLANQPRFASANGVQEAERAEFTRRQTAWERQRNEDLFRIEQERHQLSGAWVQLEAEQRRLLAEEALIRARANAAPQAAPSDEVQEEPATVLRAPSSDATPRAAYGSPRDQVSRESVLVEYEQLKSDVQRHARRLRRAR